ncbi:MAG: tetratricopeptide repeat protein [Gloeocapsa sp. UFS-A4-WI-NPMV-4B04]|jgi:tetratricopeptide (TPR) repeat protein|nr:tetratricopeptide repeat protein [Gloeocapsa sp. UFS-A4-WI-NPMV-4B04]
MSSFIHKTITTLGIATVLGGLSLIVHTIALSDDHDQEPQYHHSSPTAPSGNFRVPELTARERAVESLLNQGLEKLEKQNRGGALIDFNEAILTDPAHERARIVRGELLYKMGEYPQAIDDYSQAIEQNPTFAYTYIRRGKAYEAVGNYPEAIEDYTEAIDIYPEDGFGYSFRGGVYTKIGNHQKAMADLNKAIELNSGRAEAYVNRGNLYAQLADSKRSGDDYEEAASIYKKAMADYQRAAKLFSEQGHPADSEKAMTTMQALKQRAVPARATN